MHYNLCLIGFGNVARAFVRLLERKRDALQSQYGITYAVTGIATASHGCAVNPAGIHISQALELAENKQSIHSLSSFPVSNAFETIQRSQADVLLENSPVNHHNGQPAVEHARAALEAGQHVITANKGVVVHGYQELTALARAKGKKFLFESSVLGGAPVFSVFRETFPLAELHSFQGILNATTNIILSRMENGETFEEAVRYCQSIGIAETDPSADVDGWDAAIKVAALVTTLMGIPLKPQEVERQGIREITPQMIGHAKASGKRYKLVCSAERSGNSVNACVAPQLVDSSSPLHGIMNSSTGITFRTDVLPDYSITVTEREGMSSGPTETAYGLFADFVSLIT